jgi:Ca2+-binding EF-hand superfamily protein
MKSFKKMDLNGDGKISIDELKFAYIKTLGMDHVKAEK